MTAHRDEADLAVALEALGAVDDLAAGLLEHLRPLEVVLLIEAGTELHDDEDFLAVLGCAAEGLRDLRGGGHTVDRDLDGEHLRILGRLVQETQERIHRIVRVEQEAVPLTDLRNHRLIAAEILGPARMMRRILEAHGELLRERTDQTEDVAHIERTLIHEDFMGFHTDDGGQELPEFPGNLYVQLHTHDREVVTELQELRHLVAKIRLVIVEFIIIEADVGVSGDRQHAALLHRIRVEHGRQPAEENVFGAHVAPAI